MNPWDESRVKHMAGLSRAVSVSLALFLASQAVHAQEDMSFGGGPASAGLFSLGLVTSASSHPGERVATHTGFGGEIAYQQLFFLTPQPSMFSVFGLGVAAQAEGVDGFSHGRYAASGRLSLGILGTDVGIAREDGDGFHRSTSYLQLAPFLSAGMAWVAFRAAFPLGNASVYGRELGVVFTLRLPLLLGGRD